MAVATHHNQICLHILSNGKNGVCGSAFNRFCRHIEISHSIHLGHFLQVGICVGSGHFKSTSQIWSDSCHLPREIEQEIDHPNKENGAVRGVGNACRDRDSSFCSQCAIQWNENTLRHGSNFVYSNVIDFSQHS